MGFIEAYATRLDAVGLEEDGSLDYDDLNGLLDTISDDISCLETLRDNFDPAMVEEKTIKRTLKQYNLLWENK